MNYIVLAVSGLVNKLRLWEVYEMWILDGQGGLGRTHKYGLIYSMIIEYFCIRVSSRPVLLLLF